MSDLPPRQHPVVIPIPLAAAFIARHHRYHPPPVGARFALGVLTGAGLAGVAIIGRPVPPAVDDGVTAEITRTGTDGTLRGEAVLYCAAWNLVRADGYTRLITHTQAGEITRGLREVGLRPVASLPPRSATHTPARAPTGRGVDGVCRTRWETTSTQARTRPRPAAARLSRPGGTRTPQAQTRIRSLPQRHGVPAAVSRPGRGSSLGLDVEGTVL